MKRNYPLLICLILFITSCSKEAENPNYDLLLEGEWEMYSWEQTGKTTTDYSEYLGQPISQDYNYQASATINENSLIFTKKPNSVSAYNDLEVFFEGSLTTFPLGFSEDYEMSSSLELSTNGTWSVNGNQVTMTDEQTGNTLISKIIKLDETDLILETRIDSTFNYEGIDVTASAINTAKYSKIN